MSRLESPELVIANLREAVVQLGKAHACAGEVEGVRHDLTGPIRDAIFGLNTAVDSLAQMIEDRFCVPYRASAVSAGSLDSDGD